MNLFEQYGHAVWQSNVWRARVAKIEQQLSEVQAEADIKIKEDVKKNQTDSKEEGLKEVKNDK